MTLMLYRYPYLIPINKHIEITAIPQPLGNISDFNPHNLVPNISRHLRLNINGMDIIEIQTQSGLMQNIKHYSISQDSSMVRMRY